MSPAQATEMMWYPGASELVSSVAVVPAIGAVPMEALLSKNVRFPVGPWEMVAVNVTGLP